jgi:hypothetical protein
MSLWLKCIKCGQRHGGRAVWYGSHRGLALNLTSMVRPPAAVELGEYTRR